MLGYFGTHAHSSRSLRFETRTLRASISPSEPNRCFVHGGASLGAPTPRTAASESTNARRRDAVVLGPRARKEHAPAGGQMGGEVDDGIVPRHRPLKRVA